MSFPLLFPLVARAAHDVPFRFFLPIALFLCAALLHGGAMAAAPSLTLEEAQRLAVQRSRQLSARDHAITASREMAVATAQLPDPVLRAGIDNLPVNGPDRFSVTADFMTMRRIGVMQEFTAADKRRSRADRHDREADRSLAEKTSDIAIIQRDTALAWLDRHYAEAMAEVVAEQGAQARLEIQAAEGGYRAGRGSQADIVAARSALAEFDNRMSDIERRVRNAKIMLARWTGNGADQPLAGRPAIDAIRLDPAALDAQLAHHPKIAVLARQEEVAMAEARLADANRNADWSIELMYQQRGPAYSDMVGIGVSVPLQWDRRNRQDRELSARLAMVEQAKAERDEALRTHIAETRVMIEEWRNGRERLARYERELIPLASDRTQAVVAAYRGGKSGLADVLASRRGEIDIRLQALQLQAETARLWAQLNFLFPTDDMGAHDPATLHRRSN